MKLTGYKMDCYVKVGKHMYNVLIMDAATKAEALGRLATCPKYEGGKLVDFEREKFAADVDINDMPNLDSLVREIGDNPACYDEVL